MRYSNDSQFYSNAPVAKQWKRSVFPILPDRASNFTSFNMGELVPLIKPIEILPHDTFVFDIGSLIRMSNPLIAPLMDTIDFDVYAFFVPERLVFDKTKEFYGQNDNAGARTEEILLPRIPVTSFAWNFEDEAFITPDDFKHTLAGHFGIPYRSNLNPEDSRNVSYVNILPFRGYFEIWNWYFRDQNIQNSFVISTSGQGDESFFDNHILVGDSVRIGSMEVLNYGAYCPLLKACKKHDFFTSMTPYAEKTINPLTIPLGDSAPVIVGASHQLSSVDSVVFNNARNITSGSVDLDIGATSQTTTTLVADLSAATSASIKSLREILDLDHLLEIDATAGTRYDEQMYAHFGARPNAESYKPQLLGEAHFKINVDQVLAHAGSSDETLGEAGAYSLTGNKSHLVSQSFSEPGYLYILGVARQNVHIYSQGLDPMWSRQRRFDKYYPEFQDIGLIEYKKRTIYCSNTSADNDTFGFAPYGQPMRVFTPMVTGDLNPNMQSSLDFWTLADQLSSDVSLSPSFIEATGSNLSRALSDKQADQFIGRFGLKGTMTRVVSLDSVPKGL